MNDWASVFNMLRINFAWIESSSLWFLFNTTKKRFFLISFLILDSLKYLCVPVRRFIFGRIKRTIIFFDICSISTNKDTTLLLEIVIRPQFITRYGFRLENSVIRQCHIEWHTSSVNLFVACVDIQLHVTVSSWIVKI